MTVLKYIKNMHQLWWSNNNDIAISSFNRHIRILRFAKEMYDMYFSTREIPRLYSNLMVHLYRVENAVQFITSLSTHPQSACKHVRGYQQAIQYLSQKEDSKLSLLSKIYDDEEGENIADAQMEQIQLIIECRSHLYRYKPFDIKSINEYLMLFTRFIDVYSGSRPKCNYYSKITVTTFIRNFMYQVMMCRYYIQDKLLLKRVKKILKSH